MLLVSAIFSSEYKAPGFNKCFQGRPWSHQELRRKDWNDLHCLWWTCVKERNRLATSEFERKRLAAGYGDWENRERDKTVSELMMSYLRSAVV